MNHLPLYYHKNKSHMFQLIPTMWNKSPTLLHSSLLRSLMIPTWTQASGSFLTNDQGFYLFVVFCPLYILSTIYVGFSIVSSLFSNVPQMEMSKQDDRGTEESANQTSVSQGGTFWSVPTASRVLFCVFNPSHPTLFIFLHPPWLSSLTSSSDTAESLQADVIVCDSVCHWINHSDTTGLGNKGVIKSQWPTYVRMSACLRTLTHIRRDLWLD